MTPPRDAPLFDRTTKRAFIVAGVLAVVVGVGIALMPPRRSDGDGSGAMDIRPMIHGFKADIEAVANDEHATRAAVQAAIDRIDHEPEWWMDRTTESDVRVLRVRLVARLAR